MERWAQGNFHSDNHQVYVARDSVALGGTKLLTDLINLEYKDTEDFYNERKQEYIRYHSEGQQASGEA